MTSRRAAIHLGPGEGRVFGAQPGYESVFKALSEDTDGHLSMTEETVPPGMTARPHRHLQAVELFYVLDGQLEISVDDQTITAEPGHSVLVAKGQAHAFANRTGRPARMLAIWSPGGFEHFYEAVFAATENGTLDGKTFVRLWRENGTEPVERDT